MRLNHVALVVGDATRSALFYEAHFGFTERVHEDDHFTMLGSPQGSLLALMPGRPPGELGRVHFGFQAEAADEVREARDRLRESGVPETEWQDDGNFVRVQVSDPDGYRVELYASSDVDRPQHT